MISGEVLKYRQMGRVVIPYRIALADLGNQFLSDGVDGARTGILLVSEVCQDGCR